MWSKLTDLKLQETPEQQKANEIDARPLSHAAASTSGQPHDRSPAVKVSTLSAWQTEHFLRTCSEVCCGLHRPGESQDSIEMDEGLVRFQGGD